MEDLYFLNESQKQELTERKKMVDSIFIYVNDTFFNQTYQKKYDKDKKNTMEIDDIESHKKKIDGIMQYKKLVIDDIKKALQTDINKLSGGNRCGSYYSHSLWDIIYDYQILYDKIITKTYNL